MQLKCVDYASNCRLVVLILKSRKACWYGFCLFFVCLLWKQVGFQIKQEDVYKRQVVRILAQTLYKYSDRWLVRRKNCSGMAVLSVGFRVQVVQIRDYRFISVYDCSSVPLAVSPIVFSDCSAGLLLKFPGNMGLKSED